MTRFVPRLALAILASLLAGCGFALRGAPTLPVAMENTYLQVPDDDSLLVRELKRRLKHSDVSITERREAAAGVLEIHAENSGQRILSVTAMGGPEEYEVFQIADFSYRGDDGSALKRVTLTLTRDYTFDRNDVLGKQREYDSLRHALAEEMAVEIVRRLSMAVR